jgi:hypothetical protein
MATKRPKKTQKSGDIIFTENAIVISLSAAEKNKAMKCLEKSGKITFSVKEHSVTKLPQILENGKQID